MFAAGLGIGAWVHDGIVGERETVTEVYTVKPGDTLWDISLRYQAKDCRNVYLPEFKSEIENLNTFLRQRQGYIFPGDKIVIEYMIKK